MLALSVVSVLLSIVAGYLLKANKVVEKDFGQKLLMVGFYFTVPAIFLRTLSEVEFSKSDIIFLLVLFVGTVLSALAGLAITKLSGIKDMKRIGSIVLASLIMNTGFVFSFAQSAFGDYGVAKVALANLIVATSTYGVGYIVAAAYGNKTKNWAEIVKKPLTAPPFIAILLAIFINITNLDISKLFPLLDFIGQPTGFLNALAVGSLLEIKKIKFEALLPMAARYGVGIILVGIVALFSVMSSMDKAVLAAVLLSPLAFNSVTLASLENLDVEYNAAALSTSLLLGMITVPLCIILFS
jgi:predicted permease